MGYAVIVSFDVKPEAEGHFLELVRDNARQSVATEPGCARFDVIEPKDGRVWLYEIYDDRTAFDAHLASAHFKAFDAAVRDLILGKDIVTGAVQQNAA